MGSISLGKFEAKKTVTAIVVDVFKDNSNKRGNILIASGELIGNLNKSVNAGGVSSTNLDSIFPIEVEPEIGAGKEGAGDLKVPKIGDIVKVTVTKDPINRNPTYKKLKKYNKINDINDRFKEDYPDTSGEVTESGNFIIRNDREGNEHHTLGRGKLNDALDEQFIKFQKKEAKAIIKSALIELGTQNTTKVVVGTDEGDSDIQPILLGDDAIIFLDKFLDGLIALTVTTPVGPSGPPINLATFIGLKAELAALPTNLKSKIVFAKKGT